MKHYAIIGERLLELALLDVIWIVASNRGFTDVDVEPFVGRIEVRASGPDVNPVKVSGASYEEACEKFLARVFS